MLNKTAYEMIGEKPGVVTLVNHFYDIMDQQESASGIREMHAKSLRVSREKLVLFLSGWLGGPDIYTEKYGHPRLRQRHLPFDIGVKERDQWLNCMYQAIETMELAPELNNFLKQAFWKNANHMRNREENDQGMPFPLT